MSLAVIPITEKYLSITPPLVLEDNTLVGNINNALSVIAANSIHNSKARVLQQKMVHIPSDWDFNYTENKRVLVELWHFFHSVEQKHIEFCDKRGCPDQCDCHSISTSQRLLLGVWWNSFKTLVKEIDDRVDNHIVLCVKPRSAGTMEDTIYFVLTDIYLNMANNHKYEVHFNDIFYSLIMEKEGGIKNNPGLFAKIVDLLEMIRVEDFKFVGTGTENGSHEEYVVVDFYDWWKKFGVFKNNLKRTYKKLNM